MINFKNLNRQHETIINELQSIEAEIRKGRDALDVMETALHISRLAGQLKIHMLEEDKFLYPVLLECSDQEIRELTKQYIQEMGSLANDYTEFKSKYNVGSKIANNKDSFLREAKIVMEALKARMAKEDNELYRLIQIRGI
jgi:hemerythrin-like domain-containing protein